jgi:hypothetical protein
VVIPPFDTSEARLLKISGLKAVVGKLVANGVIVSILRQSRRL